MMPRDSQSLLCGRRVALRAVEPEDLELMYLVENDTTLWKHGAANVPYSRHALRRFIEETGNDIYADGQLRLTVTLRGSGTAIGFLDLQNYDVRHNRAEVGIVLLPEMQHEGYAAESLEILSRYASGVLRLHLLYAVVAADNMPARNLFLRAGYSMDNMLKCWLRDGDGYSDACLFMKRFS